MEYEKVTGGSGVYNTFARSLGISCCTVLAGRSLCRPCCCILGVLGYTSSEKRTAIIMLLGLVYFMHSR
jgi:hypothetical protein